MRAMRGVDAMYDVLGVIKVILFTTHVRELISINLQ